MFVLKERHSMICPSRPTKRILPVLHRRKSTRELLSSGYLYYIVFPSKNRKGFSLLQPRWLPYPSSLKSMMWPAYQIWGTHTGYRLPSVRRGPALCRQMPVTLPSAIHYLLPSSKDIIIIFLIHSQDKNPQENWRLGSEK